MAFAEVDRDGLGLVQWLGAPGRLDRHRSVGRAQVALSIGGSKRP